MSLVSDLYKKDVFEHIHIFFNCKISISIYIFIYATSALKKRRKGKRNDLFQLLTELWVLNSFSTSFCGRIIFVTAPLVFIYVHSALNLSQREQKFAFLFLLLLLMVKKLKQDFPFKAPLKLRPIFV